MVRRFVVAICMLVGVTAPVAGCSETSSQTSKSTTSRRSEVIAATTTQPTRALGAKVGDGGAGATANAPSRPRALCQGAPLDRDFPSRRVGQGQTSDREPLGSTIRVGKGRWVWINLWAAWCVPCKEELPLLFSWKRELAATTDFAFLSLDDDERQFQRFLEAQPSDGLRASYWLPEGKTRTAWLKDLGLEAAPELPVQVLVNPRGKVHCIIRGAIDQRDLPAVRKIVTQR